MTHPIGSFLLKVRLQFGLAWLIGMVEPWKKHGVGGGGGGGHWEGAPLFPQWAARLCLEFRNQEFCLCPEAPMNQTGRDPNFPDYV